jgi:hypothetical protein
MTKPAEGQEFGLLLKHWRNFEIIWPFGIRFCRRKPLSEQRGISMHGVRRSILKKLRVRMDQQQWLST